MAQIVSVLFFHTTRYHPTVPRVPKSRASAIVQQTRNTAKAWAKASPEDRKIILDYWVLDVLGDVPTKLY